MTGSIALQASFLVVLGSCATAPKSQSDRDELDNKAHVALNKMTAADPGLVPLITNAAGYVVFPGIAKAGFGVGGAWGRGVLYVRGRQEGYVQLSQASIGAQLGGQSITELIVFRDQFALDRLRAGTYELTANASAVLITVGASASVRFDDGVAVFALPVGAMYELSVGGQKLSFEAG